MKPTNKFRWVIFHLGDYNGQHPSSFLAGILNHGQVLQQWWEWEPEDRKRFSDGDIGEWRDVPVEKEE